MAHRIPSVRIVALDQFDWSVTVVAGHRIARDSEYVIDPAFADPVDVELAVYQPAYPFRSIVVDAFFPVLALGTQQQVLAFGDGTSRYAGNNAKCPVRHFLINENRRIFLVISDARKPENPKLHLPFAEQLLIHVLCEKGYSRCQTQANAGQECRSLFIHRKPIDLPPS